MKTRNVLRYWSPYLLVALGLLLLFPVNLYAQNYDPFVKDTDIQPSPLLPLEFGGTGVFSCEVGNLGDADLPFPQATEGNLMKLTISLGFGVPDVTDPNDPAQAKAALTGPLTAYFDFSYNPAIKTYTGIQKAMIPGSSAFFGYIPYRVTVNKFKNDPGDLKNGAAVDISAPGYANASNDTGNDFLYSYTYVEAFDYGDAPDSYGDAEHEIDLRTTGGLYDQYIYLGSAVDPESGSQHSVDADGDDVNQAGGLNVDDEDGVDWSAEILTAGQTANVPLTITLNGYEGQYLVQHWVDWGSDGSFSEPGDAGTTATYHPTFVPTHPTSLPVAVPVGTPDGFYYTRVRMHTGSSGIAPDATVDNGEVEDYLIYVGASRLYGYAFWDKIENDVRDVSGDGAITNIAVQLWFGDEQIATTNTAANGYYDFPDLVPGEYEVRFIDSPTNLVGLTGGTLLERNRAIDTGESYAVVESYMLLGGNGMTAAGVPSNLPADGEPVNAGFTSGSPTSSGIDLRAYQTAEGVVVEFVAYDVENDGTIKLVLLDANGDVIWTGYVDVMAGPRFFARFLVPGLNQGQSYDFRVRDEVGNWWEADGVIVESFEAEMTSASLAGVTLSFDSLPDRAYEIQWAEQLGSLWQTVTNVPSQGEQTSVLVLYPETDAASGFFKIILK